MDTALREQMLASATDAVNTLCTFAQDRPLADFDAREERGAVRQSKRIGACAVLCGLFFGRAVQFEKSLRLVRLADTIRLLASARNAKSTGFVVAAAIQNTYGTRGKVCESTRNTGREGRRSERMRRKSAKSPTACADGRS